MRAGYMLNDGLEKRSINRKDVRQDKEKNIESKTGCFNSFDFDEFLDWYLIMLIRISDTRDFLIILIHYYNMVLCFMT